MKNYTQDQVTRKFRPYSSRRTSSSNRNPYDAKFSAPTAETRPYTVTTYYVVLTYEESVNLLSLSYLGNRNCCTFFMYHGRLYVQEQVPKSACQTIQAELESIRLLSFFFSLYSLKPQLIGLLFFYLYICIYAHIYVQLSEHVSKYKFHRALIKFFQPVLNQHNQGTPTSFLACRKSLGFLKCGICGYRCTTGSPTLSTSFVYIISYNNEK